MDMHTDTLRYAREKKFKVNRNIKNFEKNPKKFKKIVKFIFQTGYASQKFCISLSVSVLEIRRILRIRIFWNTGSGVITNYHQSDDHFDHSNLNCIWIIEPIDKNMIIYLNKWTQF